MLVYIRGRGVVLWMLRVVVTVARICGACHSVLKRRFVVTPGRICCACGQDAGLCVLVCWAGGWYCMSTGTAQQPCGPRSLLHAVVSV